jgi:peptidoglycan/xylan/chitin deacetylase (PgdA/CDA1 family)
MTRQHERTGWRGILARAVFRSGLLGIGRGFSRAWELRQGPTQRWPRLSRVRGPKFVILCYHRVGTGGIPLFSGLPADVFAAQMRYLRENYRLVSLDQLCDELQDPDSSGQAVAVTFDDGYGDLYTQAFPVLQKYQIPATVFIVVNSAESGQPPWYDRLFVALKVFPADRLRIAMDGQREFSLSSPLARLQAAGEIVFWLRGQPDALRREFCAALERRVQMPQEELEGRMLSWEQIRTMQRAGISIGSHTMSHPVVSRINALELEMELFESKRILEEKVGTSVRHFAFPFGQPADCGTAAGLLLTRSGYRSAGTTSWGVNQPGVNPFGLYRVQIGEERSLAMFALKLSQLFFSGGNVGPATAGTRVLHSRDRSTTDLGSSASWN